MKKLIIQTALLTLLIVSCTDNDILKSNSLDTESVKIDSTKMVGKLPKDSLSIKHMMQSNSELIISDRIIYKNSNYILDLSPEEATQLSISDEVYQKYIKIVSEMNKKPKE